MKKIAGQHPDPRFDNEASIRAQARALAERHRTSGQAHQNPYAQGSVQYLEYNAAFLRPYSTSEQPAA